ncbi:MAG: DUF308 domain-containing protein [Bacteroidaceae bacterium]|nr:DUF308 domain-containing protein [Bacteroidaceae bacterium]
MKTMSYSVIRGICAIVMGLLLVAWPEAAIVYLVIAIGAMFLVPGAVSILGYILKGRALGAMFPIAGVGSLLFGLWLMISPAFFVGILMYVLGAVLVFAGISQLVQLSNARGWAQVSFGFYVMPVLILIAGLVVLLNPFAAATIPFIILGVSSIVYGITDIINLIRFRKKEDKTMSGEVIIEDVTPIEELSNEIQK